MIAPPLRIAPRRFWLWSCALVLAGAIPALFTGNGRPIDLYLFLYAGRLAGTPQLLHPPTWAATFAYPPAFAFFYAPLARLPYAAAFALDIALMCACTVAAGIVAGRVYGVQRAVANVLVPAWLPVTFAVYIGQNAPLGLLLALLTIAGLVRRSVWGAALPLALLLYKPTYALPLIVALVLHRRWRTLGIVAGTAPIWYVLSAVAAGGDWRWPVAWLAAVQTYAAPDFALNAVRSVALPALLLRCGLPSPIVAAIALAIATIALARLRRADVLEASSMALLLGLALGPHAWGYDAVMCVPAVLLTVSRMAEPHRTRVVSCAYLVAATQVFASSVGVQPLLIVTVGGSLAWLRWPHLLASRSGACRPDEVQPIAGQEVAAV